ncbi:Alkyl hydroperoxide reductase and/or thiol-specific antioxidant family (AhpC/TSA) protein [hydrothermal vent metagenome]|uniref:Alkyl hydroperoxide reductase and/or thiol-specific antioxidant family (AhpC/TSA) protein n=1 Tax=hydrothermal vent metagenome TaxID=652676 RepID=A0A3B1EA86_9ZZZZ
MSDTKSSMSLSIGSQAKDFNLPDANGTMHKLDDIKGENGTLIIFMCNHCPFVIHYFKYFKQLENICNKNKINIIGINANDFTKYTQDTPEKMLETKQKVGFNFTYLVDESQQTAKNYDARCTPDLFLFDENLNLYYAGQIDDSRPTNKIEVSGKDIERAINDLISKNPSTKPQNPSLGCNIKWKQGNEPH